MKIILLILSTLTLRQIDAQVCFSNAVNYTGFSSNENSSSLLSKDFNADGHIDLIQSGYCGCIQVLLGNGSGSFSTPISYSAGANPYSIFSSDFNNDGKDDIAVANYNPSGISVLLGDGIGGFGSPTTFSIIIASPNPASICSSDLNGDSFLDLAVALNNTSYISVLFGDGQGNFGAPNNFATGAAPFSIISDDFNYDGKNDLAIATQDSISILLGNGTGSFGTTINYPSANGGCQIISGDFNYDGIIDLATANFLSNNLTILFGIGNGSFTAPTFLPANNSVALVKADINGDGKDDIVSTNQGSNNVSIFLNNGTGIYGSPINYGTAQYPASITSADFNEDGKLDIAAANYGPDQISILLSCATTNINSQISNKFQINIFPNPTSTILTIETKETGIINASLFDISGKQVFSNILNNKTNIDVSKFESGIYTLTIKTDNQIINEKLIISH